MRKHPSLTIDEAFQQLLVKQKDEPHVVCEEFNQALREKRIRLQVDGGPPDGVRPDFIATHLRVAIEKTPGDGWTAKMRALRALERSVEEYEWTVLDVNSLLKSESPSGRKRGRKPKFDWATIDREIAQRCIDKKTRVVKVPDNISKFTKVMLNWCDTKFEEAPEERAVRAAVTRIFDLLQE
jgi:hypothetical protein